MGQAPDSLRDPSNASHAPRLIDRFRAAIRSRHYSRRTEKTYWFWIRYFIFFHKKRHPREMGGAEVQAFLSWLATERNVAAATQNQALAALPEVEYPNDASLHFMSSDVLTEQQTVVDGKMQLPGGFGLGVTLDQARLGRVALESEEIKA